MNIIKYDGEMDDALKEIAIVSSISLVHNTSVDRSRIKTLIQALKKAGKSIEDEGWLDILRMETQGRDPASFISVMTEEKISREFQKSLLEIVIISIDNDNGVSVETLRAREKLGIDINCKETLKMADIAWITSPVWAVNTYIALRNYGYEIDSGNKKRSQIIQGYEKTNDIKRAKYAAKKLGII